MTRQRLPSTGSFGRLSPLPRYYALLRLPAVRPALLWFSLCSAVPLGVRCSLPSLPDAAQLGPGAWSPGAPPGLSMETVGPPRFLGNPRVRLPCSRTPAGPWRLALAPPRCCPRCANGEDPSDQNLSRLYHTAFALAVYASQPGSPRDHARLASGWWLAFAGWDSPPTGLLDKFRHHLHESSCPRLGLAQWHYISGTATGERRRLGRRSPNRSSSAACARSGRTTQRSRSSRSGVVAVGKTTSAL
jgi:hypothetical protein